MCGARKDRLEILPSSSHPRDELASLLGILDSFPTIARFLQDRRNGRPSFEIAKEYDVQDVLFICIRSLFDDARLEDPAPKLAGRSKRVDIVLPSIKVLVEVKCVRDQTHARNLPHELMIDIESYHSHPACKHLLAFVYDAHGLIDDPQQLETELSGRRVKGDASFEVKLLVRPR